MWRSVRFRLDFLQRFAAVLARHVEVEQDDVRGWNFLEGRATMEIVQQLLAVVHRGQPVAQVSFVERFAHEHLVFRVVFRHEDLDRPNNFVHLRPSGCDCVNSLHLHPA